MPRLDASNVARGSEMARGPARISEEEALEARQVVVAAVTALQDAPSSKDAFRFISELSYGQLIYALGYAILNIKVALRVLAQLDGVSVEERLQIWGLNVLRKGDDQ